MNLHGFSRATGDIDIMISYDQDNVSNLLNAIDHLKLSPKVPVKLTDFADSESRHSWITEKNMKVFSVYNPNNPMEQLDVMLENDLDFEETYKNVETVLAGDIKIPIISIDDLIEQKKNVGRERDLLDVKTLKKIKELKNEIE